MMKATRCSASLREIRPKLLSVSCLRLPQTPAKANKRPGLRPCAL